MVPKKEDMPKVALLVVLILGSIVYLVYSLVLKGSASASPASGTTPPARGTSSPSAASAMASTGAVQVAVLSKDPADPKRFYGAGPQLAVRDPFVNGREGLTPALSSGLPSSGGRPGPLAGRGRGFGSLPATGVEFFDPATGAPLSAAEARQFKGFVVTRRRGVPGARPVGRGPGRLPDARGYPIEPAAVTPPGGGNAETTASLPEQPAAPEPTPAPPPPEPLLAGTIQGSVPMAVIRFPQTSRRYIAKVGDWLEGVYEVTEISSARVVLKASDGQPKVIALGGRPNAT